jgi:hypothetical protein
MPNHPEIKIEHQTGGWVWAIVLYDQSAGSPLIIGQSREAFPTHEAAQGDAECALRDLIGPAEGGAPVG